MAGAHTQTQADVWSIEAAAESGRRAAQLIDARVVVLPQYRPSWIRAPAKLDDLCYSINGPHIVDVVLIILLGFIIATAILQLQSYLDTKRTSWQLGTSTYPLCQVLGVWLTMVPAPRSRRVHYGQKTSTV